MANTYSSLYYHLIFSTKNRIHWIHPEIQHRVWAYLGGIARRHKMTALEIGGFTDHVHSLDMRACAGFTKYDCATPERRLI